eukprot:SAG31_NODE_281_length_18584_cov_10.762564_20_plen_161_part_00
MFDGHTTATALAGENRAHLQSTIIQRTVYREQCTIASNVSVEGRGKCIKILRQRHVKSAARRTGRCSRLFGSGAKLVAALTVAGRCIRSRRAGPLPLTVHHLEHSFWWYFETRLENGGVSRRAAAKGASDGTAESVHCFAGPQFAQLVWGQGLALVFHQD